MLCATVTMAKQKEFEMAYVLQRSDTLPEALRRVALEQIDIALDAVEDSERPASLRIHRIRRCCKRLRGLLRLVEPGLKTSLNRDDKLLRKAMRRLVAYRDARILWDTHQYVMVFPSPAGTDGLDSLSDQLYEAVDSLECSKACLEGLEKAAFDLEVIWERAAAWRLKGAASKIIAAGYGLTYQRALDGQREAYTKQDARSFHRWRAQVEYHHHHTRLLERAWPLAMMARAQAAEELAGCLGRANDLAVYTDFLITAGIAPELVNILMARALEQRTHLWAQAEQLGQRLFHQPAKVIRKDMAVLWRLSEASAATNESR